MCMPIRAYLHYFTNLHKFVVSSFFTISEKYRRALTERLQRGESLSLTLRVRHSTYFNKLHKFPTSRFFLDIGETGRNNYYRLLPHSSTSIKTQDKKSNKTQDNKNTNQYKVNVPN